MGQLSNDAGPLGLDADGARLAQDQRLPVERGGVDAAHPAVDQHVVHGLERGRVLQHAVGESHQPDPGAAVEVEPAAAHVDGPFQVRVAGDGDSDVRPHPLGDLLEGGVAVVEVERLVAGQPVEEGASQRLVLADAGHPAGQPVPDELRSPERLVGRAPSRRAPSRRAPLQTLLRRQQHGVRTGAGSSGAATQTPAQVGAEELIGRDHAAGGDRGCREAVGGEAPLVVGAPAHPFADDRQHARDTAGQGRLEHREHADRSLGLRLQQVDPGIPAFHLVHDVLDHLGAGVRLPHQNAGGGDR